MKISTYLAALFASAMAQTPPPSGTGPYKSIYYEDSTLPEHTIFTPAVPPSTRKMPVVLWGNGQCFGDGLAYSAFLSTVASHGMLVIANGWVRASRPKYQGDVTKDLRYFTDAIAWVQKRAGEGNLTTVDAAALGVAGHSCGGWQAVEMRRDPRVRMIAPFGYFTQQPEWAGEIRAPVGAFVGERDGAIALPQLRAGWPQLPRTTPGWWGTFPGLDHGGTFDEKDGGRWAGTFAKWALFTLAGDAEAGRYFKGDGAERDGWGPVRRQGLEAVRVG